VSGLEIFHEEKTQNESAQAMELVQTLKELAVEV
jgi:hypothetical protein